MTSQDELNNDSLNNDPLNNNSFNISFKYSKTGNKIIKWNLYMV